MKYLFVATCVILVLLSVGTLLSFPNARTEVPVLYWVTDPNPAREEQVAIFHRWLINSGYGEEVVLRTTEDVAAFRGRNWTPAMREAIETAEANGDAGRLWAAPPGEGALPITVRAPLYELRVDSANRDVSKMVIQGVSGVGGDIMDINSGSGMRYFHSVGLLRDVTEAGKRLGFDPTQTFAAMEPELTLDGRQYGFPCNVALGMFWVNRATLKKFGQPMPPERWTFEEFERLGKAFVEAANPPGERQTVFYASSGHLEVMYRSLGLSMFNESLTRCALDDERFLRCIKLLYKWTYEDHILPSSAERDSFDTQSGYGGAVLQLFNRGNYALFPMGRYALIQLRKFGPLDVGVVELPHGGFPNAFTTTRAAAVYVGGDRQELAEYFLGYLASEDYNMQIVRDADALTPNPRYAETEEFLRPEDYPNEWGAHEAFIRAENTIAIGGAYSPYVLHSVAGRLTRDAVDGFMNDRLTAEEATAQAAFRVNAEIRRTLEENPGLRAQYAEDEALQEQIEESRRAGRPVPVSWIGNPFHRRYYLWKGWAYDDANGRGEAPGVAPE
ncbi:MAG: carbohydrate ABC transporter substrate-binding protein [Candidatus Hydrogenedentes bacterium]|nr:carbohydrate ABC transporter substrate-binding protein [Candidatus Hydrogenedentota bacterium]